MQGVADLTHTRTPSSQTSPGRTHAPTRAEHDNPRQNPPHTIGVKRRQRLQQRGRGPPAGAENAARGPEEEVPPAQGPHRGLVRTPAAPFCSSTIGRLHEITITPIGNFLIGWRATRGAPKTLMVGEVGWLRLPRVSVYLGYESITVSERVAPSPNVRCSTTTPSCAKPTSTRLPPPPPPGCGHLSPYLPGSCAEFSPRRPRPSARF